MTNRIAEPEHFVERDLTRGETTHITVEHFTINNPPPAQPAPFSRGWWVALIVNAIIWAVVFRSLR